MEKQKLIVIAGPTASGKTACAVKLCQAINGAVVSADSMQIYKGMDILSAAPTEAEMGGVEHYMLGITDPSEKYSAAMYRDDSKVIIEKILSEGKQPVVCGGTGLYIDALTRPISFSERSDEKMHEELLALANEPGGRTLLHKMLEEIDPQSAARLHENDIRRVARAIEIYRLTGITQTEQTRLDQQRKGEYDERLFALEWTRDALYDRINRRVDGMVKAGLIEEVTHLHAHEDRYPTAVQAIGYKEIVSALEGRISMEEAILSVKQASRNLAKRQITWFRRDPRTIWVKAEGRTAEQIAEEIQNMV